MYNIIFYIIINGYQRSHETSLLSLDRINYDVEKIIMAYNSAYYS
jgi:hypothetical protein